MSSATPAEQPRAARRTFRPGGRLTAAALAGVAALLALGTWQLQRLEWKTALIAGREARLAAEPVVLPRGFEDWDALDFRRVVVRDGEFLPDRAQLFGVSGERGRVGHDLLVPLRRPDGGALLVDLGFVPADGAPPAAIEPPPVEGVLRYVGDAGPAWLTPDNEPSERLWYWYDLPGLRDATGLELLPVVLDASGDGPGAAALPNNHLGYAITWYGLAAALAAIYVALGLKRRGEEEEP